MFCSHITSHTLLDCFAHVTICQEFARAALLEEIGGFVADDNLLVGKSGEGVCLTFSSLGSNKDCPLSGSVPSYSAVSPSKNSENPKGGGTEVSPDKRGDSEFCKVSDQSFEVCQIFYSVSRSNQRWFVLSLLPHLTFFGWISSLF